MLKDISEYSEIDWYSRLISSSITCSHLVFGVRYLHVDNLNTNFLFLYLQ